MQTQVLPTVAAKILMAMNETTKIARAVGNRVVGALLAVGKFALKYVELFMTKQNHLSFREGRSIVRCLVSVCGDC